MTVAQKFEYFKKTLMDQQKIEEQQNLVKQKVDREKEAYVKWLLTKYPSHVRSDDGLKMLNLVAEFWHAIHLYLLKYDAAAVHFLKANPQFQIGDDIENFLYDICLAGDLNNGRRLSSEDAIDSEGDKSQQSELFISSDMVSAAHDLFEEREKLVAQVDQIARIANEKKLPKIINDQSIWNAYMSLPDNEEIFKPLFDFTKIDQFPRISCQSMRAIKYNNPDCFAYEFYLAFKRNMFSGICAYLNHLNQRENNQFIQKTYYLLNQKDKNKKLPVNSKQKTLAELKLETLEKAQHFVQQWLEYIGYCAEVITNLMLSKRSIDELEFIQHIIYIHYGQLEDNGLIDYELLDESIDLNESAGKDGSIGVNPSIRKDILIRKFFVEDSSRSLLMLSHYYRVNQLGFEYIEHLKEYDDALAKKKIEVVEQLLESQLDPSLIVYRLQTYQAKQSSFRRWIEENESMIIRHRGLLLDWWETQYEKKTVSEETDGIEELKSYHSDGRKLMVELKWILQQMDLIVDEYAAEIAASSARVMHSDHVKRKTPSPVAIGLIERRALPRSPKPSDIELQSKPTLRHQASKEDPQLYIKTSPHHDLLKKARRSTLGHVPSSPGKKPGLSIAEINQMTPGDWVKPPPIITSPADQVTYSPRSIELGKGRLLRIDSNVSVVS